MKPLRLALALAASLAVQPVAAPAGETLIFATTNPAQHPLNSGFLIPWAEKVNAAAKGAVEIDIRHGPMLAGHANFYDRVADDVVQIVWGMTVFNPGRFPRTLVSTLPFMVESAEQGSAALCALYEDGAFDAEFGDIVPLLFVEFPQASLHLKGARAEGLDDVKGRKIITSSPAAAAIVGAHGGAPLSFSITEQYEALQRGAAEGTVLNFTAFPAFRLHEVTTDSLVAPLGGAMGMVMMSKARWDALSPEARAALEAHSGCAGSRAFGRFIDGWEGKARAMVAGLPGRRIVEADAAAVAALAARHGPGIEAGFAKRVPGGAALIDAFKAALAREKANAGAGAD